MHRHYSKGITIVLVMILMMISIIGCQTKEDISSEAIVKSQQTSESDSIIDDIRIWHIGVMSDVGAVPFYIAQEMGYFDNAGISVEVDMFRSALDRDSALQSGVLDGTMADMLSVVFYNDADLPIKMVGETAGDYILISSPIASGNQLKGKAKVGISSNTVIDFVTDAIVKYINFPFEIEGIAIPQMPIRLEMLKSGEIDYATLPEPLASAALQNGGEIVGSALSLDLHPGILVYGEALVNDEAAAKAFIKGYNEAVAYLNANDEDEFYDILVENLGFSELLKEQGVLPKYDEIHLPDQKTFDAVLEWMIEKDLTKNHYTYDDVTDNRFIDE